MGRKILLAILIVLMVATIVLITLGFASIKQADDTIARIDREYGYVD